MEKMTQVCDGKKWNLISGRGTGEARTTKELRTERQEGLGGCRCRMMTPKL